MTPAAITTKTITLQSPYHTSLFSLPWRHSTPTARRHGNTQHFNIKHTEDFLYDQVDATAACLPLSRLWQDVPWSLSRLGMQRGLLRTSLGSWCCIIKQATRDPGVLWWRGLSDPKKKTWRIERSIGIDAWVRKVAGEGVRWGLSRIC